MGVSGIGSSFQKVDETNIYNYTGASPWAGVNFKSAKGVAQAVGTAVVAAGVAAWEGLKWIGTKVWKWAQPYLKNFTNDPQDLVFEDKNSDSYRIQNWCWTSTTANASNIMIPLISSASEEVVDRWRSVCMNIVNSNNRHGNVPLSFDTILGSMSLKFSPRVTIYQMSPRRFALSVDLKATYHPKPIDYDTAVKLRLVSNGARYFNGEYKTTVALNAGVTYDQWLERLQCLADSGNLRPVNETDEQYMYKCFVAGILVFWKTMHFILNDYTNRFYVPNARLSFIEYTQEDDYSAFEGCTYVDGSPINDVIHYPIWTSGYPQVTNADFLHIAAGYEPTASDWAKFNGIRVWTNKANVSTGDYNYKLNLNLLAGMMLVPYLYSQYEKVEYPNTYSFIPYVRGTSDFTEARYRIKSDQESANLINAFVNIALIVIVIATIIIIGSKLLKRKKLKKLAKFNNYMGQQDNAIWSLNKKLSPREQKKYLRYSRKADKIASTFNGLATDSGVGGFSDKVQRIATTISSATGIDIKESLLHGQIVENQDTAQADLVTIKRRIG